MRYIRGILKMNNEAERCELIEEDVLQFIKDYDVVSFVDLCRMFKIEGEYNIVLENKNIIFWINVSEEFCILLRKLCREKKIYCKPTNFLTYLIDGRGIQLEIAKRIKKYKDPHWLPLIWRSWEKISSENLGIRKYCEKTPELFREL